MAELLDKIHLLQASLPYVTQSSFHAQHTLIQRYVERSSGRLSASCPWELAINFCRGDGSRPKGIVGRPVNKAIDHECFHGFGHAMFYAVASRQLEQQQHQQNNVQSDSKPKPKQHPNKEEAAAAAAAATPATPATHIFIRPHSGFELTPESQCELHELCKGASPSTKERRAMDPNDEASSNSYQICFEGAVHSIRLISEDAPQWTDKEQAIETVSKEMKRCSRRKSKRRKGGDNDA